MINRIIGGGIGIVLGKALDVSHPVAHILCSIAGALTAHHIIPGKKTTRFYKGASGIAKGQYGLFAGTPIKTGEFLFISFKKIPGVNSKVWERQFEQSAANSFINHSENANSKSLWIPEHNVVIRTAKKDITAGEEISLDYNQTLTDVVRNLGYTTENNWLWFK